MRTTWWLLGPALVYAALLSWVYARAIVLAVRDRIRDGPPKRHARRRPVPARPGWPDRITRDGGGGLP